MPIWLTPTILRYVSIAVGAILLVLAIYAKGRHDVQVKFDAYKVEVAAAAKAQELKAKETEARQQKINEDTRNAYNTQLSNLRSYYSLRLGKSGGSLPQVSSASTGADVYSPDNLPAPAVLAGQCAETTLNLLVLQNWVRSQIDAQ